MYTEIARRIRLEGTVILQLTLDKGGEVSEVKVLRGMGRSAARSGFLGFGDICLLLSAGPPRGGAPG